MLSPKEIKLLSKVTHTPVFTTALVTVPRIENQQQLLTDGQMGEDSTMSICSICGLSLMRLFPAIPLPLQCFCLEKRQQHACSAPFKVHMGIVCVCLIAPHTLYLEWLHSLACLFFSAPEWCGRLLSGKASHIHSLYFRCCLWLTSWGNFHWLCCWGLFSPNLNYKLQVLF